LPHHEQVLAVPHGAISLSEVARELLLRCLLAQPATWLARFTLQGKVVLRLCISPLVLQLVITNVTRFLLDWRSR
jgi:hypothetical protein